MSVFKQKHKEFWNKKIEKIINKNEIKYRVNGKVYCIEEMKKEYFEKKIIHKYRVELPGTRNFKNSEVTNLLYKINKDKITKNYFIATLKGNKETEKEFEKRVSDKEYDMSKFSYIKNKKGEKYALKRSYYNDEERNKLLKRLDLKSDINTLLRKILFFKKNINNRINLDYKLCTIYHLKGIKSEVKKLCTYSKDNLLFVDSRINIEDIFFKLGDKKRNHFNSFLRFLAAGIEKGNLKEIDIYKYLEQDEFAIQVYNFFVFANREYKEEDLNNKYKSQSIEKKLNNIFYNNSIDKNYCEHKTDKSKIDNSLEKIHELRSVIERDAKESVKNTNCDYNDLKFETFTKEEFNTIKSKTLHSRSYQDKIEEIYNDKKDKYFVEVESVIDNIINIYSDLKITDKDKNLRMLVKKYYKKKFDFSTKEELYNNIIKDKERYEYIKQSETLWILKSIHNIYKGRANKYSKGEIQATDIVFNSIKIKKKILSKVRYKYRLLEINKLQNNNYLRTCDKLKDKSLKKQIIKIEETFKRKVSQNISSSIYYINKKYNKSEYLRDKSYVYGKEGSNIYNDEEFYDLFSFGPKALNIDENEGAKEEKINYFGAIRSSNIKEYSDDKIINSLAINILRNYTYHANEITVIDSDTLDGYKDFFKKYIDDNCEVIKSKYSEYQNWKLLSNSVTHFYSKEELEEIIGKLDFSIMKDTKIPRFSKIINILKDINEESETKNYYKSTLKKILNKYDQGSKEYNAIKYLLELIYNKCFINSDIKKYSIPATYRIGKMKELSNLVDDGCIFKAMINFQNEADGDEKLVREYQKKYEIFVAIIFNEWLNEQEELFSYINKDLVDNQNREVYSIKFQIQINKDGIKSMYNYLKYYISVLEVMSIDETSKLKQNINKYRIGIESFFDSNNEQNKSLAEKLFENYIELMTGEVVDSKEYLSQLELIEQYIEYYLPLKKEKLVPKEIIGGDGQKGIKFGEDNDVESLYKKLYCVDDLETLMYKQYIKTDSKEREEEFNILYQKLNDSEKTKYFIPNEFLIEFDKQGFLEVYKNFMEDIDFKKILNEYSIFKGEDEELRIETYQKKYSDEYEKIKNNKIYDVNNIKEYNEEKNKYNYLNKIKSLKLLEEKIKFDYVLSCRIISEVRKFDKLDIDKISAIRDKIAHFNYLSEKYNISYLYKNISNYYTILNELNYLKERNALKEIVITHFKNHRIDFSDIIFESGKIKFIDLKPKINESLSKRNENIKLNLISEDEMNFILKGVIN